MATKSNTQFDSQISVISESSQKGYNRELMLQRFIDLMRAKHADVHFIFDCEDATVKIPAHKEVLTASSGVFHAMFNGELKETGDVEIIDASPTAFEEFLQFFYGNRMKLSMENIAEVLALVDKYDVIDCYPICVDFLKENLTRKDILWGLHLALKFQLTDLKSHCTSIVQKNFKQVWDMFNIKSDGRVKLISNPDDRYLTDKDVECILQYVCVISKNIVFNLSTQVDRLRARRVFPIALVNKSEKEQITEYEIVRFSLTGPMLLTDILCSKIFEYWGTDQFNVVSHQFEMCIEEWQTGILFSMVIDLTDGDNHVQLENPINIEGGRTYAIIMKSPTLWNTRYTYQANIPTEAIVLMPGVKISFPTVDVSSKYSHSLISHLYFERLIDD